MGSRLGVCPNIFRVIFCLVNLLILLLGIASIAVGIYLLVSNQSFAFVTGSTILSGAVIILIAGIVTAIIAALGFLGALFKWRPLLLIYVLVLSVIVILEIVAGILGYVFRNQLESITDQTVANVTADFIRMYRFNADDSEDSTANDAAVDGVQRLLQCCGATQGPGDWLVLNPGLFNQSNGQFPRSCVCELSQPNCARFVGTTSYMVDVNATVWSMPCANATNERVLALAYVAGGIGIAFGIIEIFGILVGLGLCCCITMADKDKEVV